jgi:hypothetical protein
MGMEWASHPLILTSGTAPVNIKSGALVESRKSLEAILMTDQELADQIAIGQHIENRNRFPAEELEKYRGQWIGWSLDGTRIIAHSHDPDALDAMILPAGEDRPAVRCGRHP